jgi:outer membrane protein, heavy metal efflux system
LSSYSVATLVGVVCVAALAGEAIAQDERFLLTRDAAVARALDDDPGVDAADASLEAADANVRGAGRWANPTLDVLQENVSGSGIYSGTERAETTYSLRQPFELGGDRSARRRIAEREQDAAELGAHLRRLDLIEEVEHAFIDAQATTAALAVAENRLDVARELAAAVDRRVHAARDPLMAGSRARARLAEAEVELESARRAAVAARVRLASYWSGDPNFRIDFTSFEELAAAPAGQGTADLALSEAQAGRADAALELERARRIPDVDLQAGWRQFTETDDTAMVFGLSMPLPIWDRNEAGVARARAERDRAQYEHRARERSLQRAQATLLGQLEAARTEVEALNERVIPASEEALELARQGYAMGGFSYIDVLDAQRALVDARMRRISALRAYHRANASLERLTGASAETIELRGTQP